MVTEEQTEAAPTEQTEAQTPEVQAPEAQAPEAQASATIPEPDPKKLTFGMPVEMFTEKVHTDRDGNEIIAFKFRPANSGG